MVWSFFVPRNKKEVYLGKQVTGNMGDRSEVFTFDVEVIDKNGNVISTRPVERNHGNAISLGNFPVGTLLRITERAKTVTVPEEAYGTTYSEKQGAGSENAPFNEENEALFVEFRVSDTGNTVTFYNDRKITVDTGIPMESKPYWFLLGLIPLAGLGAVLMAKRRRREEA